MALLLHSSNTALPRNNNTAAANSSTTAAAHHHNISKAAMVRRHHIRGRNTTAAALSMVVLGMAASRSTARITVGARHILRINNKVVAATASNSSRATVNPNSMDTPALVLHTELQVNPARMSAALALRCWAAAPAHTLAMPPVEGC
jgi:hypothetical protein